MAAAVGGVLEHFSGLRDPRSRPTYWLEEILFIALAAVLCGAED